MLDLGVRPGDREGDFVNDRGEVLFCDPSIRESGKSCLLARREPFLRFLDESNLTIVWTVLSERMSSYGDFTHRGGLNHVNGVFRYTDKGIEGQIESRPRSARIDFPHRERRADPIAEELAIHPLPVSRDQMTLIDQDQSNAPSSAAADRPTESQPRSPHVRCPAVFSPAE